MVRRWGWLAWPVLALVAIPPAGARTITEALSAAYLTNPDLRAARMALNAANEQRPQALANWAPRITIGPQWQSQTNIQPSGLGQRRTTVAGPSVAATITQPITQGGGELARLRQAEAQIRQARAGLLGAEQVVLYNAARAFQDVDAARQIVAIRTAERDRLRQELAAIELLLAVNDATAADAALTRARLERGDAFLAQASGTLEQARARYRQTVGVEPPVAPVPAPRLDLMPADLTQGTEIASQHNPAVVAAAYAERAAKEGVTVATAALLPSVSLNAQVSRAWDNYRPDPFDARSGVYDSAQVTLQVQIPIFQGGAEWSTIRQAEKVGMQRRSELDSARRQAISEVEQTWHQRVADEASLATLEAQVRALRPVVGQYRREMRLGLRTLLDVLDTYQELVDAEVALAQARRDRVLDDYGVLRAMGGLTARSLGLPVAYHDPEGDYQRTRWQFFGLDIEDVR